MENSIFENSPNRINLNDNFSNSTLDYAVRCVGKILSDSYPAHHIDAAYAKPSGLKGVLVNTSNGNNIYACFVLISYNKLGKYLFVDKAVYSTYLSFSKSKFNGFQFQVYDLKNKWFYVFGQKCYVSDGYIYDEVNFMFDIEFAEISREITGAELLVLSMGIDANFDSNGN